MVDNLHEPRSQAEIDEPDGSNPYASPARAEVPSRESGSGSAEALNPWLSMCMRPRETIRQLLDSGSQEFMHRVAMLGGIGLVLDQAIYMSMGENFAVRVIVLTLLLVGGATFGFIALYAYGLSLRFAGRALGGVGTAADCRTAYAWSNIPSVWLLPVYLCAAVAVVVYGSEALLAEMIEQLQAGAEYSMDLLPEWLKIMSALAVISRLWQFVLTCQSVGEAHQISSAKGLLTVIFANLLLTGVIIVLVLPLQFLLHGI